MNEHTEKEMEKLILSILNIPIKEIENVNVVEENETHLIYTTLKPKKGLRCPKCHKKRLQRQWIL